MNWTYLTFSTAHFSIGDRVFRKGEGQILTVVGSCRSERIVCTVRGKFEVSSYPPEELMHLDLMGLVTCNGHMISLN